MPARTITAAYILELESALPAHPIAVVSMDFEARTYVDWHSHGRHQLVYTVAGAMVVDTEDSTWAVPSQRAIWMPAGVPHDLRAVSGISLRNLLILPRPALDLATRPSVINVTGLLRELILRASEIAADDPSAPVGTAMTDLILQELRQSRSAGLRLPEPKDVRLRRICEPLKENPADSRSLDEWSALAAASSRTLVRLFAKETGMSFTQWRQQARLLKALELLALGRPVNAVAYDVGYDSPSAFIEMFKRSLGQTPAKYFH